MWSNFGQFSYTMPSLMATKMDRSQFMIWAEHMDALALEQYGSQAGLVAIFQSLNMQLFWMWFAKENLWWQYSLMMPNPVTIISYMDLRF